MSSETAVADSVLGSDIVTEGESEQDIQEWMDGEEDVDRIVTDDEEVPDDDEPAPRTAKSSTPQKPRDPEPKEEKDDDDPEPRKKALAKTQYDPNARVKVKVNGEELEITLDQAVREYRRRAAADQRFQEAASLRRDAEAQIEAFKADPWEAMRKQGIDPDDAASKRILAKIEEEKLAAENPSELHRRRAEKELEAANAKIEAQEKAAKDFETEKQRNVVRQKIDQQFTSALKEVDLPKTPYTVARMADVLQRNLREDPRFDATPKELAQLVQEDLRMELVTVARALGPGQLEEFLGADAIKALRKHDLDKVRNPALSGRARSVGDADAPPRRRKVDYTDPDEADAALEEWAQG